MEQNGYLKEIISFLNCKDKDKLIQTYKELKEFDIDATSNDLYKNLYNNLLYYYKAFKETKFVKNEQRYVFTAILDIVNILYESKQICFNEDIEIKLILIYLIDFFNESKNVDLEIVCKIFFSFKNQMMNLTNIMIDSEIADFEKQIWSTASKCFNRYIHVFENQIKNVDKINDINNFEKLMNYLNSLNYNEKETLPFHLQGFTKYYKETKQNKFLLIKIYKYIQEINPYKNEQDNINYFLYQGYSLYECLEYKIIYSVNEKKIKEFYDLKKNRFNNIYARKILEYAIKVLNKESIEDILEKIKKENIYFQPDSPKISNNFDNPSEYYKDIYEQFVFSLMEFNKNFKVNICKTLSNEYSRVLWLNFIKILLLNLKQKDIEKENIKVIFYFISTLFNPDVDIYNSLVLKKDAIPILLSEIYYSDIALHNQEIFKILDKDYSEYYTTSENMILFNQKLINSINKDIKENDVIIMFLEKNKEQNMEVKNITECNKYLPFPLLQHYLKENVDNYIQNKQIFRFDFYRNCFSDLEISEQQEFIDKIRVVKNTAEPKDKSRENSIRKIIQDKGFLMFLNEIMKSNVMKNAYLIINRFYSSNGKIGIGKELEDIKKNKVINLNEEEKQTIDECRKNENINGGVNNFINDRPIISYYNQFCKEIENFNYKNLFIIMGLPKTIKGFTFRFLKIILNSKGIDLIYKNKSDEEILLKAYLIFVIIHEENHFIKRYFNIKVKNHLCNTPKINGYDEGGKQLIEIIFGHELINQNLNLEQAKYILDIKNWSKSIYEFKKDFSKIKNQSQNESSIIYWSTSNSSICDHTLLHA